MKEKYANEILKRSLEGYENISHDFSQTRKVFWEELNFLGNYIKDGDNVLDVGCGNGRFFEVIKNKKIQYLGIDNSISLIEYAKDWHGDEIEFVCADALNLPHKETLFDVAVSFGVLHHIPSKKFRKQFLNEINKALKKDGLLILTVWNLWNKRLTPIIKKQMVDKLLLRSHLDFKDIFLSFGKKQNVRYLHAFTEKELSALIKKAGFKIIKLEKIKRRGDNENIVIICRKK